jgi:hypothetical protein
VLQDFDGMDELLTAKEVAAILRVQPSTVFAAAATGRLPVLRIWTGRRKSLLRFRRKDISALLDPAEASRTARARSR